MKKFMEPEVDTQKFNVEDVITASTGPVQGGGGGGDHETGEDEF